MAPLVALGLALVGQKLQNTQQRKAHQRAQEQQLQGTLQDIAGMRASRAGDSGYMQRAMGGMANQPMAPQPNYGGLVQAVGGAFDISDAQDAAQAQKAAFDKQVFSDGRDEYEAFKRGHR